MGYGKRTISLLKLYYEGKIPFLEDETKIPNETVESVSDSDLGLLKERIGNYKYCFTLIVVKLILF